MASSACCVASSARSVSRRILCATAWSRSPTATARLAKASSSPRCARPISSVSTPLPPCRRRRWSARSQGMCVVYAEATRSSRSCRAWAECASRVEGVRRSRSKRPLMALATTSRSGLEAVGGAGVAGSAIAESSASPVSRVAQRAGTCREALPPSIARRHESGNGTLGSRRRPGHAPSPCTLPSMSPIPGRRHSSRCAHPLPHAARLRRAAGARPLLLDGAMGTLLFSPRRAPARVARGAGGARTRSSSAPSIGSTIAAGADIIETDTFGANRFRLAPHGLADRAGRAQPPRGPARARGAGRGGRPGRPRGRVDRTARRRPSAAPDASRGATHRVGHRGAGRRSPGGRRGPAHRWRPSSDLDELLLAIEEAAAADATCRSSPR